MLKVKSNVKFLNLTTGLIFIISRLDLLSKISAYCPSDITITSVADGEHVTNSKHYVDEAIDIRSNNFSGSTHKLLFKAELEKFLNLSNPCPFTVLLEGEGTPNEHFHIQVKRGFRCQ